MAAIPVLSVPIYVRYIGVANYGVNGIYGSLSMLAGIFDVAFSNTISRELARRGASGAQPSEVGGIFRTLELFAWGVAAILALLVAAGASLLVNDWIGSQKYSDQDLVATIRLMGLLLLLQAPVSFYTGCLFGLHRHGLINVINVAGALVIAALSICAVVFISPTISAFFIAQFIGRIGLVAAIAIACYVLLVRDVGRESLRATLSTWRKLWRFAIGMNGIGVLTVIVTQADIVILSRPLSATDFGYYTIARTVSQALVILAVPAYQSAVPQLSRLANTAATAELAHTLHRFCQYMALVLIPPGIVICLFSQEVLMLWTRNPLLAGQAGLTLSLLAAGSMIYGLGYMLSALQLAAGAVRLMVLLGVFFAALLVPALVLLVHYFGAPGAASGWLAVNVIVIGFSAIITLRRHVPGEINRWVTQDILLPLGAAALPALLLKLVVAGPPGSRSAAVALLLAAVLAVVLTGLVLPEVRAGAARIGRAWAPLAR